MRRRIHWVYVGGTDNGNSHAPFTITRNVGMMLRSKGLDVIDYNWDHFSDVVPVGPDDIVLGHPHYREDCAIQRLFKYKCRAKFTMHPLHLAMSHLNMPFDGLTRKADKVFSIMGPAWYDRLDSSAFAHWKPKIVRLDMAVDAGYFHYARRTPPPPDSKEEPPKRYFNEPGRRSFVYIGRDEHEKGTDILAAIFERLPECTLHYYGSIGDPNNRLLTMPNVKKHGWTHVHPGWANDLIRQSDFIISTGRSDANPTSLLEGMAWGLIPFCTPESGYNGGANFVGLSGDNVARSANILREWNNLPDEVLLERALRNRQLVVDHYNWKRFCDTVWNTLEPYVRN